MPLSSQIIRCPQDTVWSRNLTDSHPVGYYLVPKYDRQLVSRLPFDVKMAVSVTVRYLLVQKRYGQFAFRMPSGLNT